MRRAVGSVHEPDDDHGGPGSSRQAMQRVDPRIDEVRTKNQVLRWIAVDGKLGQQEDIRLFCLGPIDGLGDPLLVAGEIAHAEIQLGSCDSKWHTVTIRPVIPCRL
jgi:hypothetical protein